MEGGENAKDRLRLAAFTHASAAYQDGYLMALWVNNLGRHGEASDEAVKRAAEERRVTRDALLAMIEAEVR